MSRKDLQILLDTSFILPFLGIDVGEVIAGVLHRLRDYELYYSELSLLEALWKIVKVVSFDKLDIVLEGLTLIRGDLRLAQVDEKAVRTALELYRLGHRDLIDNLLYGISLSQNLKFLTIDRELVSFVKSNNYPDTFISPIEL
ncbi:MAG: PIN domain-containing protein [Desulfurococcaceae archaeon]|nr:PIN domain-containing protein [Desulfurococcaceae archaeon]